MINATLPMHMKVIEKYGYNRYTLLLNHKKVSTKSLIDLDLNAEYLAELYTDKGGVITFKNLSKIPRIAFFEEGLALITQILESDFDFKEFVVQGLIKANSKEEFSIYKEMLFASLENVYHIPFVFENKACLLQLRKNAKSLELFLYFSIFGSLKFVMKEGEITLYTPFEKVEKFLAKHLNLSVICDKKLAPLFEFKRLLDLKG